MVSLESVLVWHFFSKLILSLFFVVKCKIKQRYVSLVSSAVALFNLPLSDHHKVQNDGFRIELGVMKFHLGPPQETICQRMFFLLFWFGSYSSLMFGVRPMRLKLWVMPHILYETQYQLWSWCLQFSFLYWFKRPMVGLDREKFFMALFSKIPLKCCIISPFQL